MNKLPDELLELAKGGSDLPENWEELADKLAPMYKSMYKDVNFNQAVTLVKQFLKDPADQEKVIDYLKKYFDENGNLIK